jgi:hypothetical protein
MATVNNASGIYASLGYNFDDPNGAITTLSADTQAHLNTMPAFITTWQAQDIANNDIGGYYQNPMQTSAMLVKTTADSLFTLANGVINLANVATTAKALSNTANSFLQHTNRISGVTPFSGLHSNNTEPHLDMAMSAGKTALYITNQTDGIIDTSPILGSFTSLFIKPQLEANAETLIQIISDLNIANTISNTQPYTSNLAGASIQNLNSFMTGINVFITFRQTSDVSYYQNLTAFIEKYNQTKRFNSMGQSENYLVMNYIGTDKLKARIS